MIKFSAILHIFPKRKKCEITFFFDSRTLRISAEKAVSDEETPLW